MRFVLTLLVFCSAIGLHGCRERNIAGEVVEVAPIVAAEAADPVGREGSAQRAPIEVIEGAMTEPGRLSVSGERAGLLFVDGISTGVTVPVREYEVAAGRHVVQVLYGDNELSPVRPVIVRAGQNVGVFLRAPSFTEGSADALAGSPAQAATPDGSGSGDAAGASAEGSAAAPTVRGTIALGADTPATVFVDGMRTTHRTPWVAELAPGEYQFQLLYDDGRLSRQIEIDLESAGRREVTFTGTDMFVLR